MTDTNKVDDTARFNFIEANPTKSLRYHKKRWAFVGLTSYEYETYSTAREAIDAVMGEIGINGLTAAETLQTASVTGLTKVNVEPVAYEQVALKFATGKKITYEKPVNLESYIELRPLVYASTLAALRTQLAEAQAEIQKYDSCMDTYDKALDVLREQRIKDQAENEDHIQQLRKEQLTVQRLRDALEKIAIDATNPYTDGWCGTIAYAALKGDV